MDVDNALAEIAQLRDERAALVARIAEIDSALQQSVRTAFDAGHSHTEISAASGLSRARVYQVAKGTRR